MQLLQCHTTGEIKYGKEFPHDLEASERNFREYHFLKKTLYMQASLKVVNKII